MKSSPANIARIIRTHISDYRVRRNAICFKKSYHSSARISASRDCSPNSQNSSSLSKRETQFVKRSFQRTDRVVTRIFATGMNCTSGDLLTEYRLHDRQNASNVRYPEDSLYVDNEAFRIVMKSAGLIGAPHATSCLAVV